MKKAYWFRNNSKIYIKNSKKSWRTRWEWNSTPTVGKFIMDGLSALDKVAYVRFASVYKNFKEVKDFEQFVGNINENKS